MSVYYTPEHLLKCFACNNALNAQNNLWGAFYHFPDFTNEETVTTTLDSKTTLPRSQRQNSEQAGVFRAHSLGNSATVTLIWQLKVLNE